LIKITAALHPKDGRIPRSAHITLCAGLLRCGCQYLVDRLDALSCSHFLVTIWTSRRYQSVQLKLQVLQCALAIQAPSLQSSRQPDAVDHVMAKAMGSRSSGGAWNGGAKVHCSGVMVALRAA